MIAENKKTTEYIFFIIKSIFFYIIIIMFLLDIGERKLLYIYEVKVEFSLGDTRTKEHLEKWRRQETGDRRQETAGRRWSVRGEGERRKEGRKEGRKQ